jgi:hypothetical protein
MGAQMSDEQSVLRFDYDSLDIDTRRFVEERTERVHRLARMTAAAIAQIGQDLTEVKVRLGHGQFLKWIDREFGWQERSAQNFMNVYHNVAPHLKSATVADLQIEFRALYLIAAPSTPEPVRTAIIEHAESGHHVTREEVREVLEEYKRTGENPARLIAAGMALKEQIEEERDALPSPAEARRIAIETGKHTLDRNGIYQPPLTKEQQADWKADRFRIRASFDFCSWVEQGELSAKEAAAIVIARHWRMYYTKLDQAVAWLKEFAKELDCAELNLWRGNDERRLTQ